MDMDKNYKNPIILKTIWISIRTKTNIFVKQTKH